MEKLDSKYERDLSISNPNQIKKPKQTTISSCSCKGIRTCKICEKDKKPLISIQNKQTITKLIPKIILHKDKSEYYSDDSTIFNGFFIIKNLFTSEEIKVILEQIEQHGWTESQSGRLKQDFGPKINYKKKKIKQIPFEFPPYKDLIESRLQSIDILKDFKIDEIGNLKYNPDLGAHIEFHVDHLWSWGERIVGVNLLSSTTMTFRLNDQEIDIPIGVNETYVMSRSSRLKWQHGIKEGNITKERIVITCREFQEALKLNN